MAASTWSTIIDKIEAVMSAIVPRDQGQSERFRRHKADPSPTSLVNGDRWYTIRDLDISPGSFTGDPTFLDFDGGLRLEIVYTSGRQDWLALERRIQDDRAQLIYELGKVENLASPSHSLLELVSAPAPVVIEGDQAPKRALVTLDWRVNWDEQF